MCSCVVNNQLSGGGKPGFLGCLRPMVSQQPVQFLKILQLTLIPGRS